MPETKHAGNAPAVEMPSGLLMGPAIIALFSVALFSPPTWAWLAEMIPPLLREHFTPRYLVQDYASAAKASLFLAALLVLCLGPSCRVWGNLRNQARPDDLRAVLAAIVGLLTLGLVTRPSSLGQDYQMLSLAPFSEPGNELSRRLLEPAAAYFLHLNGALYICLHFAIVVGLLLLIRQFFRIQGIVAGPLELAALGTCSFVFHNFQYPGYPDALVISLALIALIVELPPRGRAVLTVLALLAHETLAVAIFVPLSLRFPWRDRFAMASVMLLYLGLWGAESSISGLAMTRQINYYGHSGPELLTLRPDAVAFGLLISFKLVWGAIAIDLWRRLRGSDLSSALVETAPLAAACGVCALSYDTSRMAEVAFLTALVALARLWPTLPQRTRRVLVVAQLLAPSLYVSPIIDNSLGASWMPGLYSAYNGFATNYSLIPPK